MEVEKRSSKGGFLQLFDWNVKSRKKLFSNKPDIPESSKHGKENLENLTISRLHQMNLHESIHGPSLTENDWASSMGNDEGIVTKAPGVVARLMGLDSLPTLDSSDSNFTPFIDSHSFRHSLNPRITTEFESEHFSDYGMRNKLDGFTRNPVEDRLQKLQNRPIERFQTEVLPPRSAKSVPISHHRMLSPIKSPGFILSRNAAYIMEAASKIIDQSPKSTVNVRQPTFGSSSVPLRIRDLKEKMEAAQRTSRFSESSQRLKSHNSGNSSKSQTRENLKQNVVANSKQKNKSVSVSTPSKTNVQKVEGLTSRNRNTMKQKEDENVKSDKKQRITPKRVQNRSPAGKSSEVLAQNNQKQNCSSNKDRSNLKPRVPYQNDRKTTSTNVAKTSKKVVENSPVGVRKVQESSSSKTKNISNKKRREVNFDGSNSNNVVIKEKERSVKCNITIDGSSNWESVDRKNGMDVVSFTFTSPIKKPVSETDPCGQPSVKSRVMSLKFQDDDDDQSRTPFATPVIDSDALSVLLEQKLKELSSLVDASSPNSASGSCLPGADVASSGFAKKDEIFNTNMQNSDVAIVDKPEWQGVKDMEIQNSCTISNLDPSLSDDSCVTSNSTTTLTSNGNKQSMSTTTMEHFIDELELQDSATSSSMAKWSSHWESEYIQQIINHTELLSASQKGINVNLFNQIETQNKNMDPFTQIQRKALFDCVTICLEARRERAFNGSYNEWAKWSKMFENKDLLANEIYKEIIGWTNMEEMMVDEVVDKDMSRLDGKWLDFEGEALEEGVVIENEILNVLIDEIVADFLSC